MTEPTAPKLQIFKPENEEACSDARTFGNGRLWCMHSQHTYRKKNICSCTYLNKVQSDIVPGTATTLVYECTNHQDQTSPRSYVLPKSLDAQLAKV